MLLRVNRTCSHHIARTPNRNTNSKSDIAIFDIQNVYFEKVMSNMAVALTSSEVVMIDIQDFVTCFPCSSISFFVRGVMLWYSSAQTKVTVAMTVPEIAAKAERNSMRVGSDISKIGFGSRLTTAKSSMLAMYSAELCSVSSLFKGFILTSDATFKVWRVD